MAAGNSKPEALRVLKRHLADVLYAAMRADEQTASTTATLNTPPLDIGASHWPWGGAFAQSPPNHTEGIFHVVYAFVSSVA